MPSYISALPTPSPDTAPVATETLVQCPICGSGLLDFWVQGTDRLQAATSQTFEYSRCRNCGVVFLSRRPLESAIGRFYAANYAPHRPAASASIADRVTLKIVDLVIGGRSFRGEVDHFYDQLAKTTRVLDFGCGAGLFLDRAQRLGCETIGVDFFPKVVEEIARRGHRALLAGDAGWDLIEDRSIGFARMNHVVEHLYRPGDVLKRMHEKMAPGAYLHIATPNPDSWTAEEFRECWWGLECPRHIILFPPASLAALVEQAGFVDTRILQEPITKDMARSFIYREIDRGRIPPQDVGGLADDGLLNLRFALTARSAVRRQRSDRIHLLARKAASS